MLDKNEIVKEFVDSLSKMSEKQNYLINSIRRANEENSLYSGEDKSRELEKDIQELVNTISSELLLAKSMFSSTDISVDTTKIACEVEIEKTENGYYFRLPCLLNKRSYDGKYNARKYMRLVFEEVFERYERAVGFKKINSKVRLTYVNHFFSPNLVIDNDNIETKYFTDCITNYIIRDDNPLLCDLCIKGVLDSKNFTEVFLEQM